MSVTRAIAANTVVQVAGRFAGNLLGVLTVAVMTRSLGASGYGAFTTAISFLQLFGILVDFGLTLTMTRMLAAAGSKAAESALASNVFTLRLVSAALFFGLAPVIALALPYAPEVRTAISVGALSFFAMASAQVLTGVFQKHLATGRAAAADVAGRAVLFASALYASATGAGLLAFVTALVLANAVQFAIAYSGARRLVKLVPAFDFSLWKKIAAESWPIGVSIAFNLVYLKGDVLVMSLTRPQAEVGLYGAAYKVLDVITVIPMIFMGLVLPLLAASWSAARHGDFSRRLSKAFDALSIIALPLAFGAWAVANDLMAFVAGREFAASGPFLTILMIAGAAVFWSGLFGHAVVAIGLQRRMIKAYAADAVLSILLYAWAVPRFGGTGAAWVTVFSEVFIMVATGAAVLRHAAVRLRLNTFAKALAASLVMSLVVVSAAPIHVLLRILLGAIVYGLMLAASGVLTKEMLGQFRKTAAMPDALP